VTLLNRTSVFPLPGRSEILEDAVPDAEIVQVGLSGLLQFVREIGVVARKEKVDVRLVEEREIVRDGRSADTQLSRKTRRFHELSLVLGEQMEEMIERADVLLLDQPLDVLEEVRGQVVLKKLLLPFLVATFESPGSPP
jgi:hypothetical protein